MDKYIDCGKVYVEYVKDKGLSAFARQNIKEGELVEKGIAILVNTDGHEHSHLFTWSQDKTKWAYTSGLSTFYNTSLTPNCIMNRDFDNNTFTIKALQDIKKNEELTHLYRSLQWRKCFNNLNQHLRK